jgi:ribonuclease G
MQSAFVDIGLERDAFLYVSDFFDEEAEFERIVVDGKKGDAAAEKAAAEKIEQARIEREHHIESTHERVNPLLEVEGAVPAATEEEAEETGTRRRGRRGGRGRKRGAKMTSSQRVKSAA